MDARIQYCIRFEACVHFFVGFYSVYYIFVLESIPVYKKMSIFDIPKFQIANAYHIHIQFFKGE